MIKRILFILFISITSLGLSQNKSLDALSAAPNPFTNSTKISFISLSNSKVFFTVKNVLGKTVFRKTLQIKSGKNSIAFYKNNLAKGIYIYSMQGKSKTISKRFVIK
jgi:hypothetical protein